MSGDITRRQALTLGAIGAGVLVIGATGAGLSALQSESPALAPNPTGTEGAGGQGWNEPSVVASSAGALELDLTAAPADIVVGGATATMLAYNGTVPGPTIHLRPGDRFRVRLRNALADPTNLHTHGLMVSAAGSGDNPFVRVGPGESFDYEFVLPADHPPGVFWYHPHHHGMVADQLFAGLYGAIVVDDEDWSRMPPRVAVVSDVTFDGGSVAQVSPMDRMTGRTGAMLLTNGRVAPDLTGPAGSEQRVLIVNACSSRYLDLRLSGLGARLRGIDSGRRPEAPVDRLLLTPGNRADLVLTTPAAPVAMVAAAYDRGRAGMGMMGGASAISPEAVVLTVAPDPRARVAAIAPTASDGIPDLRGREVAGRRTLTMSMGMGGGAGMRFLIDGRGFDPERVDQSVRLGAVEEWTIVNTSPMAHPFHLHVWPMQVIRDGRGEVSGIDVRDVVDVPAGGAVTVRIAFDRLPARTVYHCHILDHEDLGMMGVVEVA
ncbi:MAG: multicopper oxidase family protein [Microbacterium sp.]|uniref:multicopper oxidase family protein n=1 Tax=unclassified Microbacterium TaxID=2609290 RepID=UPI000C506DA2|nr:MULTISPECIES: multicopper oxidase family protein [unclassified Microbacterium]MBU19110.1 copper oxidase [Microbacterium sp.]HAM12369.1 copper oxidase [Microbacterium sp.]HBU44079.1 copper oxidase [Microbacterium sp.]|tara:strand:- start:1388 stop:2857 length:1470 start_codon:yes stop_codon:yes gene_type:complete